MDRRKVLSLALKGTGAIIAGTVTVPVLIDSLTPVLAHEPGEDWRSAGRVRDFQIGEVAKSTVTSDSVQDHVKLGEFSVYVWRRSEVDFVVFSRSCTDLGCPVEYDPGSRWFYCPCHGGVFDQEGERRAGPPPRPLWRYHTRLRDGVLEIDLRSVPPMV